MKLLINTQYIDLSAVIRIEVIENGITRINDNILRFHIIGTTQPIDIRLDLSKLKFFKNSDEVISDIKSKTPTEKLITEEDMITELEKYCGGFGKYYLVEDVMKLWTDFKDGILYKWLKTESAIKEINSVTF